MLLRASGRSRRLACVINFWAALQSSRSSKEFVKGRRGWGLTLRVQSDGGVGFRPKTEPNLYSSSPCPARGQCQPEYLLAESGCPREESPTRAVASRIFVSPATPYNQLCCLQVWGQGLRKEPALTDVWQISFMINWYKGQPIATATLLKAFSQQTSRTWDSAMHIYRSH